MNEDGDLAIARFTSTGADVLARAKIFDTTSWTAPTLVGTTLYARDREKIVALNLGGDVRSADRPSVREAAGRTKDRSALRTAPRPDVSFAGSWQLDTAASSVADGATFAGLTAAGAPKWLFVTQPDNGTLILESPVNTGHTRFYRPGRSTTTDIANGTITMSTAWVGKTLVAEGRTVATSGATVAVKETFSRDGDALVVAIVSGDKTSTLRYTRLRSVGPCESWPTPCKRTGG